MAKNIFHLSVENAFYFSCASFVIVWVAGFLFEMLDKTAGALNLEAVIIIVLSMVLILFFLALTNVLLSEDSSRSVISRLAAVFLFALVSSLMLFVLGALFFYKF